VGPEPDCLSACSVLSCRKEESLPQDEQKVETEEPALKEPGEKQFFKA